MICLTLCDDMNGHKTSKFKKVFTEKYMVYLIFTFLEVNLTQYQAILLSQSEIVQVVDWECKVFLYKELVKYSKIAA